jgi:signal transduction histidine kinase
MNKTPKILIVDDDDRNVRLMESILKANNYTVIKAHDGEEALQSVTENHPDLILLDAMMPRMNGFELCLRLKKDPATRLLPVIMVTALNALEDKVQALEIGADDFLSKPINRLELLAKMRSVLRTKALHDQVEHTRGELERKNQELLRLEHLKDSLMQMIVHDLKNPLTGIMGNIELLLRRGDACDPDKLRNLLLKSRDSSNRLLKMIMDLLDISKLEEEKMELKWTTFDLGELVSESLRELRGATEVESKTLLYSQEGKRFEVEADRELIRRVLGNLLSNALKHTPGGSEIRVEIEPGSDGLAVSVVDQGEGIPVEYHAKIFEKFGQVDVKKSGHKADRGLGLTFCKMVVEAHGGSIGVKSATGRGSIFTFRLPRRRPQPADAHEEHASGTNHAA